MWEQIREFFTATPAWELILIFFARIIEVSIGTIRIIIINKGYRKPAFILAFIEVAIWVFVAAGVLDDLTEKPFKAIIYSLGFASGVYVGSVLENKLAVGKVLVQAITPIETGQVIATVLRNQGYGVTSLTGQGKDAEKTVLMVYANRKGKDEIINLIKEIDNHAMVVSNDVSTLHGGYINSWRRFIK